MVTVSRSGVTRAENSGADASRYVLSDSMLDGHDGPGNEVRGRRAGGSAGRGTHRPSFTHEREAAGERTAAARFGAPGVAGWSPVPGRDAVR